MRERAAGPRGPLSARRIWRTAGWERHVLCRIPMPREHEGTAAPTPYPARKSARDSATVSLVLLRGTIASLRCGEELDAGRLESAREFFVALQAALAELDLLVHDEPRGLEVDQLRSRESKLSRALAVALRTASARSIE